MIPENLTGHILILDDPIKHQQFFSGLLSDQRFTVRFIAHPNSVTELLNQELPDLILINVELADTDGFKMCAVLKSNHSTAEIPVILFSESDAVSEKVKGFSAGAADYLILPIDNSELVARIVVQLSSYWQKKKLLQQNKDLQHNFNLKRREREEYKKEEEKLTNRNSFVESLLNLIPDIVFIHDLREDRSVYVNEGVGKVLGYSSEELKGMGNAVMKILLHPDVLQEHYQTVMPLFMKERDSVHLQFRLRHKDGSWRWFDGTIMVYTRDPDGSPLQILGVEHDITTEKIAQDNLKQSEKLLIQSQRVALLGHYTLDIKSGNWTCSEMLYEIFGIPKNYEKTVSGWLNLVHPEFVNEMQSYLLNTIIAGKKSFNKEYKVIKYNSGETIWVHGLGELEFDNEGNPIRLFGTIQDITAKKVTELGLAERTRFIESILNLNPNIIYIYDLPQKKNVYINKDISKVLGYSVEQIEQFGDQVLSVLMHPDDLDNYFKNTIRRYQTAKDAEKIKIVYRMKHQDGSWRWIESTEIIYSRNADGSPREILGSANDFTEYKKAQRSLQRLNRDLVTLSKCNEVLVRIQDEKTLLNQICQIICEKAGYHMAWVGYLEDHNCSKINPIALFSENEYYVNEILKKTNMCTVWARTPEMAIVEKRTKIIHNFADKTVHGWEDALQNGIHSAVSLPLLDEQSVLFGALSIYATEIDAFSREDIRLLEELTEDLAFGISTLRLRLKRREAENNLTIALREKEILIQELYHRTRNTMQVISAYLQMHGMLSKDPKLQQITEDIRDRIQAIALVHEKLYQSENLSKINLSDYLNDLVRLLFNRYDALKGRVKVEVETEPALVTIDIGIPCGLVVTELLSNSFKYAFPGDLSGIIRLVMKRVNDTTVDLCIEDNGAGRGRSIDISHLKTLGLPMAESIVKSQLQGSITLNTKNGFCWHIQFRTDSYKERV